jgi:ATP-dependent DNA helicase RecQ
MSDKYQILKSYFGHETFREFQEEAVNALLNHQDLLMLLPTGGGKSLCYQLPTLLMDGVTVVVSPLLALMYDQVTALKANNISAEMISSMQNSDEIEEIIDALHNNTIKLLYVAPERLVLESFITLLKSLSINFFVIDEAHCVSEWGHDFRSDYRKLSLLKEHFPNTPIAAFTATATPKVKTDISHALHLHNPIQLQGVIFRDNLTITANYRHQNGHQQLFTFLQKHQRESGIIYTLSRKETEKIADLLQTKGYNAKAYHAGLSPELRNSTYSQFVADDVEIVVATIAFGMGIDKSNIRFVVHMSLPKTIENYYQEIGRAGRDGSPSETLLLYGSGDSVKQRLHINEIPDDEHRRLGFEKLAQMGRLASGEACRHQQIARYFEDNIDVCSTLCDVCNSPDYEKEDISKEAQMFLSAIFRTDSRFGMGYIIDILRGSKIQKISQNSHDKLSVYSIGEEHSKVVWQTIAERLVEVDALGVGEYSVLFITPKGRAILKGEERLSIKKERLHFKESAKPTKTAIEKDENFETLRTLRSQLAKTKGVPPYVIFSDKTLSELAKKQPKTRQEMLDINGIGEVKYERYGELFLELLSSFEEQKEEKIERTEPTTKEEIATPKIAQSSKKLSSTYQETLALLNQSLSLVEISEERSLTFSTILNHVIKLNEEQIISEEQKRALFNEAKSYIPKEVKSWILQGEKLDDLSTMRTHLSLYMTLHENS